MSLLRRNLALLATLAIAFVVVFPAVTGPFTATYGPASALRTLAYIALLAFTLSFLLLQPARSPEFSHLYPPASQVDTLHAPLLALSLRC